MWLGLFQSINLIINYNLGKANIVANALSRSQRTESADLNLQNDIEAIVMMMLSVLQMVLDLQQWSKWISVYQNEPRLWTALKKLQKGCLCGYMQLNSLRFLVLEISDKQSW